MSEEVQELSREGMKIIALRQRVAELTDSYEDKVADLRVELTIALQRLSNYEKDDSESVQTVEAEDAS